MRGASNQGRRRAWLTVAATALLAALLAAFAAVGAVGSDGSGASSHAKSRPASGRPAAGQDIGVLAATITPDAALLHDGVGVAAVALADVTSSDLSVRNVRATLRVPAPARVASLGRARGWRCTISVGGAFVSCAAVAAVTS